MPTLRDIIDGRDLSAASPLAEHVSKHLQDPLGATKDQFGKLQKAKLSYDMAREETQRNLSPVQALITHVSTMHGLNPNMPPTPALGKGQSGMGPQDPNQEYDEDGNPIPPQNQGEGQNFKTGQGGVNQPGLGSPQVPQNMNQTVGKMNQNRPSLAGHQPGVAPMMEKQVVPPKLGMASPGAPKARNSPAPNAPNQYNPAAKPPKGNRSLPGAKGPGDAKVANRTKQAFGKSQGTKQELSRPIKVTVHASASPLRTTSISESIGLATLKFRGEIKAAGSMPIGPGGALGPSSVMPGNVPATGQPIMKGKGHRRVKALDSLSDKAPAGEDSLALNPTIKSKGHGTSHGAKKGWSTRGKGHLSTGEKSAHHKTLDFCAKCGGIHAREMECREFSQGQREKLSKTGAAMPGGGYPINNRQDLANAKQAIGRAKNRSATIAHINKRAASLGAPGFGK